MNRRTLPPFYSSSSEEALWHSALGYTCSNKSCRCKARAKGRSEVGCCGGVTRRGPVAPAFHREKLKACACGGPIL